MREELRRKIDEERWGRETEGVSSEY